MNPIRLIPDDEFEALSPPPTLIAEVLPQGALAMLFGPSGVGKTFVALDIAFCIATGRPWFEHTVTSGPVVYIAAEGGNALAPRLQAWKLANGITGATGVHIANAAIDLSNGGEVFFLVDATKTVTPPPVLVIVDTFARSIGDLDENLARDMSIVVRNADFIRQQTGAAVLLIHHTGKNDGVERGSSALRGAMDCMISVRGKSTAFTISSEKAKDLPEFKEKRAALAASGPSCVVVEKAGGTAIDPLATSQQIALKTLGNLGNELVSNKDWMNASGLVPRTFQSALKALVGWEYVTSVKNTGKNPGYSLTEKGRDWITANCNLSAIALQGTNGTLVHATSHPPIGGECSNTAAVENGDITGSGKGTP